MSGTVCIPAPSKLVSGSPRLAQTGHCGEGGMCEDEPMFGPNPAARSDLKAGTIYAVAAPDGSIFFGQVCADKSFAFFRARETRPVSFEPSASMPVMSRFSVNLPSVGDALRAGIWMRTGRAALSPELELENTYVQWPVGTLNVQVWRGPAIISRTRVEDSAIQDIERMSAWDADAHVPLRLLVDFAPDDAARVSPTAWAVGGPIWRERRVREEYARRSPGGPRDLPLDWVATSQRH